MHECRTQGVELTPDEVQRLNELPDAAHDVKVHLLCELENGHAGPHWALAQTQDRGEDDTKNWWLRWEMDSQEWTHEPDCPDNKPDDSEF